MPVPVRVYNAEKTDSADFRLVQTTNNQEFLIDVDFNVAELKIDPEYWLVSKTESVVNAKFESVSDKKKVFPNPFTESFSVLLPTGQQLVSVQLFNIEGQLLKQYHENKIDFNWPDLPEGMYMLNLKSNLETVRQTIIKL